jgi:hypothetical protein
MKVSDPKGHPLHECIQRKCPKQRQKDWQLHRDEVIAQDLGLIFEIKCFTTGLMVVLPKDLLKVAEL